LRPIRPATKSNKGNFLTLPERLTGYQPDYLRLENLERVVEHYHRFPHAYQVSNQHDYRRLSGLESGPEGVVIHTGNALQHSDERKKEKLRTQDIPEA